MDEYSFMSLQTGLKEKESTSSLAMTYAVFDSDSLNLYKYCKEQQFSIEHESKRNWNATIGAQVAMHSSSHDAYLANCKEEGLCDPVLVARMPTPMAYRMIKIDFSDQTSDMSSMMVIKFESRNPYLQTYQSILSSFFLITTLINATTWGLYLYRVDRRELGHVQYWLLGGLAINFLFNLPVKQLYFVYNEAIIILVAFINALSISYVLMINLVLLHGISASFDLDWRWFYVPKILLIVPVFLVMATD